MIFQRLGDCQNVKITTAIFLFFLLFLLGPDKKIVHAASTGQEHHAYSQKDVNLKESLLLSSSESKTMETPPTASLRSKFSFSFWSGHLEDSWKEGQRDLHEDDKDNKCENKKEKKCCSVYGFFMIFGAVAIVGPPVTCGLGAILDPGIFEPRLIAFFAACGLLVLIVGGIGSAIKGIMTC